MKFEHIPEIQIDELIQIYDALLFDAYGVLINSSGPLPKSNSIIDKLNSIKKPYLILTNDSSRSIETSSLRYGEFGLDIPTERIITSGSLIKNYFSKNNLINQSCCVLGTDDTFEYVKKAGGLLVSADDTFQVLVIGAISGYPFVETTSALISKLFSIIDSQNPIELILMNPDLLYPKTEDSFGLAAASLAKLIEEALALRYPMNENLTFTKLGKPYMPIFEKAFAKTRTKKMVMIGDQLHTDIQGAKKFGIDSVLMETGISSLNSEIPEHLQPTYRMKNLE